MPKESDPRIYNLWLQSKFLLNMGNGSNESFQKASDLLMQAYAIDSLDARVWSGLARVYYTKILDALTVEDYNKWSMKSRHASEKSVALDGTSSKCMTYYRYFLMMIGILQRAESNLQNALAIDPANGVLYLHHGRYIERARAF
jgi:Tfp pilus assembly protein PilF